MNYARAASPLLLVVAGAFAFAPQAARADQLAYISGGTDIWAWDTTTNTNSVLTDTNTGLDSLMFDAQGNIVYDSFGGGTVGRYNVTTMTNTAVPGSLAGPADMALEPGGASALISNAGGTTISRLDLTTSTVVGSLPVGLRPDGLAYDSAGDLFAVLNTTEVARIDPLTGTILQTVSTPDLADGLTYDAATNELYVASDGGGFYTVPTNLSSASFTSIPGNVFDGIASSGNDLYFVVRGQGGLLYDLGSNSIVETSPFIAGADDIAPVAGLGSSPVPEPASLGMLGTALMLLAAVARRRQRAR